jgi:hypothetical protein
MRQGFEITKSTILYLIAIKNNFIILEFGIDHSTVSPCVKHVFSSRIRCSRTSLIYAIDGVVHARRLRLRTRNGQMVRLKNTYLNLFISDL